MEGNTQRDDAGTGSGEAGGVSRRRRRDTAGSSEIDRLVQEHLWLVPTIVAALRGSWPPHTDRSELEAAGRLGLVEAATRYRPDKGPFVPYARTRIRGALIDSLRAQDWAPRRLRAEGRVVDRAIEEAVAAAGRPLDSREQASAAGLSVDDLHRYRAEHHQAIVLSLDAPVGDEDDTLAGLLLTPGEAVEQRLEDVERRAVLADAVAALEPRLRRIVVESYLEGRHLHDIGAEMGITQSRVSQLRAEAVTLLNAALERHWEMTQQTIDLTGRRASTFLETVQRYRTWRRSHEAPHPDVTTTPLR